MPQPADSLADRPAPVDSRAPLVRTGNGRRTLEFTPGDIQSEMLLARPDALVLEYTRAMMCFALFVPQPRHILMVGLGGGSLAKFCYRHFPQARITVLEIRADVIALRDTFCLPPDDARLRVLHCDAVDYLARSSGASDAQRKSPFDVLLVDGFDRGGLPPALSSSSFYDACRRALRPGGVMVTNIFTYDPDYPKALARLGLAFGPRLAWFRRIAGNNRILFAVRPQPPGAMAGRAERVLARLTRGSEGKGFGRGWSNRLMARLLVAWLARRCA